MDFRQTGNTVNIHSAKKELYYTLKANIQVVNKVVDCRVHIIYQNTVSFPCHIYKSKSKPHIVVAVLACSGMWS